jgi:hypothetical protein
MQKRKLFARKRMNPPAIAITVSIERVRVMPEMASRILEASINLEIISPSFLDIKKLIGSLKTCLKYVNISSLSILSANFVTIRLLSKPRRSWIIRMLIKNRDT